MGAQQHDRDKRDITRERRWTRERLRPGTRPPVGYGYVSEGGLVPLPHGRSPAASIRSLPDPWAASFESRSSPVRPVALVARVLSQDCMTTRSATCWLSDGFVGSGQFGARRLRVGAAPAIATIAESGSTFVAPVGTTTPRLRDSTYQTAPRQTISNSGSMACRQRHQRSPYARPSAARCDVRFGWDSVVRRQTDPLSLPPRPAFERARPSRGASSRSRARRRAQRDNGS
jgi:hypothetical protein